MIGYDVKKQQPYFNAIWKNAVALCVKLCREYSLTEKDILSHAEGYKKGIASNHGDVAHWFPKHNKTMDNFRADVKAGLQEAITSPTNAERFYVRVSRDFTTMAEAQVMQTRLKKAGISAIIKPLNPSLYIVGDRVKVINNRTYEGGTFKVYYNEYAVLGVVGDRVVIGNNGVVTAAINARDISHV